MNPQLPEIVIYTDRRKTLGYFIIFVLFALLALWLITQGGIIIVPAPAIIINERSLCDNTSLIAIGKIDWEEIETISLGGSYIFLRVFEPKRIISRQPWLKKLVLRLLRTGSASAPFLMALQCVKGTPEEIYRQIYAYCFVAGKSM